MSAEVNGQWPDALVPAELPDVAAQLEGLFHAVWECEKEWRLDDRIDLAVRRDKAAARPAHRDRRQPR